MCSYVSNAVVFIEVWVFMLVRCVIRFFLSFLVVNLKRIYFMNEHMCETIHNFAIFILCCCFDNIILGSFDENG